MIWHVINLGERQDPAVSPGSLWLSYKLTLLRSFPLFHELLWLYHLLLSTHIHLPPAHSFLYKFNSF